MQKLVTMSLVSAILLLGSCKKEVTDPPITDPDNPIELKASSTFNWRTTKNVQVSVSALALPKDVNRKFSIELENGSVVYEAIHNMKEDVQFSITLPAHITKIVYKFGTITKQADITGSTLSLNYLQPLTDNGYIP